MTRERTDVPPVKSEAPELRLDPVRVLTDPLDWSTVFGASRSVEIEVGIGKGRFLIQAATARPEVSYLGIEWANKYLRFAEARVQKRGLENVRFVRVDARELIHRAVPDRSVHAYYVFYPDPWPKKRHHKRRFLRADTVGHLARTLVPHGELHVATDHEEYWQAIESVLEHESCFERLPRFGGENFPVSTDEVLTNFEAKYRDEGRGRFRASWRRTVAEWTERGGRTLPAD